MLLTSEQITRAFDLLNDELARTNERAELSHAGAPTLIAMKCAAARTDEDVRDIRFLADHLHLTSPESVLQFYPEERLPVRTQLLIEEMFG